MYIYSRGVYTCFTHAGTHRRISSPFRIINTSALRKRPFMRHTLLSPIDPRLGKLHIPLEKRYIFLARLVLTEFRFLRIVKCAVTSCGMLILRYYNMPACGTDRRTGNFVSQFIHFARSVRDYQRFAGSIVAIIRVSAGDLSRLDSLKNKYRLCCLSSNQMKIMMIGPGSNVYRSPANKSAECFQLDSSY